MSRRCSCIYEGVVRHRRIRPIAHAFEYRLFMMYFDLAELSDLFNGRHLWKLERPGVASFRRADYLGDEYVPLDTAVRDLVQSRTGVRPRGPIRMLTHVRYFGFIFNPVSFYFCFDEHGERAEAVVAEITNTPWNERHCYVLARGGNDPVTTHLLRKEFHISPFMAMDMDYTWQFGDPGDQLFVQMANRVNGNRLFDATLTMRRREINAASLRSVLLQYPFMTLRVLGGIYWQALRLRLKGAPFHSHPRSQPSDSEVHAT